jgi:hypothetical protein
MTNDDPAIPIKRRKIANPPNVLTAPVQAVGIAANMSTAAMGRRAPYLSQTAPKTNRITMSPETATILVIQMSPFDNSNVSLTSGSNGAMENQMKKAIKNDHQE